MARYIDIDKICYHKKEDINKCMCSEYVCRDEIESLPIENVQSTISTYFLLINKCRDEYGYIHEIYQCGKCGKVFSPYDNCEKFNFCPHCGSKIIK